MADTMIKMKPELMAGIWRDALEACQHQLDIDTLLVCISRLRRSRYEWAKWRIICISLFVWSTALGRWHGVALGMHDGYDGDDMYI